MPRYNFQERNQQVLEQFARLGIKVQDMPEPRRKDLPLQGKTVVFTGALEHFTRQAASEQVEALGGRVTSSGQWQDGCCRRR
jgi:DNA ligase (NAD+)